MKKLSALLLSVLMLLSLWACSGEEYLSYYDMGLKLTELMGELASDEDYARVYTSQPDVLEIIKTIGKGDYDDPDGVYEIDIDVDDMAEAMDADLSGLSSSLRRMAKNRMITSLGTMMNNSMGVNVMAASSVTAASLAFPTEEEPEGPVLYLYVFDGLPVMVGFVPGEGNTVTAMGSFLMVGLTEELDLRDEDDVEDFFEDFADISVKITEIEK